MVLIKNKVVRSKEFAYHRCSSTLKYTTTSMQSILQLTLIRRYDLARPVKKMCCIDVTLLVGAEYIALTGDHWTSVSKHNYCEWKRWKLHSFALAMLKTDTRHYIIIYFTVWALHRCLRPAVFVGLIHSLCPLCYNCGLRCLVQ